MNKFGKIAAVAALALFSSVMPVMADTATDNALNSAVEKIRPLLSGYEKIPTIAEVSKAGGDKTRSALEAVATDKKAPIFQRTRAVMLLGNYTDAQTSSVLEKIHSDTGERAAVRRIGLLSAARSAKNGAVGLVRSALADTDKLMRLTAADAAAIIGSKDAADALTARKSVESDPGVLAKIDSSLKKIGDLTLSR